MNLLSESIQLHINKTFMAQHVRQVALHVFFPSLPYLELGVLSMKQGVWADCMPHRKQFNEFCYTFVSLLAQMILQDTLSSVKKKKKKKKKVKIGFSCSGLISVMVYMLDPRPLEK